MKWKEKSAKHERRRIQTRSEGKDTTKIKSSYLIHSDSIQRDGSRNDISHTKPSQNHLRSYQWVNHSYVSHNSTSLWNISNKCLRSVLDVKVSFLNSRCRSVLRNIYSEYIVRYTSLMTLFQLKSRSVMYYSEYTELKK